ncbi:inosine 5'-monophosphate dehydrogenase [Tepidibacillus sp. HK-1]|nr:inosine 5'-monophosphate dehydrogenase [Tepidibacillus sp. HK-1]
MMELDLFPLLSKTPPFHLLPIEKLKELIEISLLKTYSDDQVVVQQNEKDIQHIFVLVEGIAKNILLNDAKEEITLKMYRRGDVIGLIHAMSGDGFTYTIRAVNHTRFLLIPISFFDKMMAEHPPFTEEVAKLITLRLRELYLQIGKETSGQLKLSKNPYRKKVVELMTYPIITSHLNETIIEVSEKILKNQIGSVVVVNQLDEPIGIITEKDLIKAFTNERKDPSSDKLLLTAEKIMTSPLISIEPQSLYFDALHLMIKHNIKHIPIINNGMTIGMITMKNLIQSLSDHTFSLIKELDQANSIREIVNVKKKVDTMIQNMLEEHVTAKELCAIVSEFNDRMTQKLIQNAEFEMNKEGYGYPPVAYCWLSLGSEGRKEQTLQTDQDNALIYADVPKQDQAKVDTYFSKLTEKVVEGLYQCGFPKCTGGVMASNQEWRNSLSGWKHSIQLWINKNTPDLIRRFTIFIDFRPIYGDKHLADSIREYLFTENIIPAIFLHFLAEDETTIELAINRFGRFQTKKSEHHGLIDLKYGGLIHIVNSLRLLALKFKISELNSWERLDKLYEMDIFTNDEHAEIAQALDDIMLFRIKRNIEQMKNGEEVSHYIQPNSLSKRERLRLKKALMTARWLQIKATRHCAMPGSHLRGY